MRLLLLFRFNYEGAPSAVTGVEGDIADILLPGVGDVVQHKDVNGVPFEGKVTERIFKYELEHGMGVGGTISVTLWLSRTTVH
jgi:hypothetical protein